jgi:TolA-binding protein
MPLPQIRLNGIDGTAAVPLGPEAAAAAASLAPHSAGTDRRGPAVFPEDLETDASGEEYQLRSIVQGYFSLGDWSRAGGELRSFLAIPRSPQNTAKANFYLGQAYYFQGSNREALFALLAAQDFFPGETAPWIQAVLGQMTRQ